MTEYSNMFWIFILKLSLVSVLLAGGSFGTYQYIEAQRASANSVDASYIYVNQNTYEPVTDEFLQQTNDLRQSLSIAPLQRDDRLELSSANKLKDMEDNNYWGHYDKSGESYAKFVWQSKSEASNSGENLAYCYKTPELAFNALANSHAHYQVLTSKDFRYVGVSNYLDANGCNSVVMHFSN